MPFSNILIILFNLVCLVGFLASFFIIAAIKPVKVSMSNCPLIIEITVAIYKYTILITLASAGMVCAISLLKISAYKNISQEIIYITSIMILIIFQIFKKPDYPAHHS